MLWPVKKTIPEGIQKIFDVAGEIAGKFKGPLTSASGFRGEIQKCSPPNFYRPATVSWPGSRSPDGAECFFTVPDAAFSHPKIYGSRKVGDTWSEPAIPAFADPRWNNLEPFFSRDAGSSTSSRIGTLNPLRTKKDIWVVERTPEGWSEPKRLPFPFNSKCTDSYFSQAADGTAYAAPTAPAGSARWTSISIRVRPGSDPAEPAERSRKPVNTNRAGSYRTRWAFLVFDRSRGTRTPGSLCEALTTDQMAGPCPPISAVSIPPPTNTPPSLSPDERFLFFARHDGQRADLY